MESGNLFRQMILRDLMVRYQFREVIREYGSKGVSREALYKRFLGRKKPNLKSEKRFNKLVEKSLNNMITEVNGVLKAKEFIDNEDIS